MNNKMDMIQVFRGFAAILVLLFHATILIQDKHNYMFLGNTFGHGHYGVDFFFVLSGFIIMYVHYKDLGVAGKLKSYVKKRFIRIFPVYWVVSLVITPLYFIFENFGHGYETRFDVVVKSFFLIPQEVKPIIIVAWTLSHEVFFYLMFGLFIALGRRLALVVGTTLLTFSALQYTMNLDYNYLFEFLLSKYNLEFFIGCVAGYITIKKEVRTPKVLMYSGIFLFSLSLVEASYGITKVDPMIFIACSSFLTILGASKLEFKVNRIRNTLMFLGDASFSIYLTHFTLLSMVNKILLKLHLDQYGLFLFAMTNVIGTLIGSCLFYKLVELPLLKFIRGVNRHTLIRVFYYVLFKYHKVRSNTTRIDGPYQRKSFIYHRNKMKKYEFKSLQ